MNTYFSDAVAAALAITPSSSARDRTVDITTIGARSQRPRRIEIWFYRVDGEIYLSSSPARRDWYANLLAHPAFTFHLVRAPRADLPAIARPVHDEASRRRIFTHIVDDLNQPSNPAGIAQPVQGVDEWVSGSPLMHVTFEAATR